MEHKNDKYDYWRISWNFANFPACRPHWTYIAAISYSLTFYIIAEDESIGTMEAIDKSKMLMDGYKWKFFCLMLRFLGWAFLCILTLGIGFLWLMPYIQVSVAKFFDDVKANHPSI